MDRLTRPPYPPQWWPGQPCNARLPGYFNGVTTYCNRPTGHTGQCRPVPCAGDRPREEE